MGAHGSVKKMATELSLTRDVYDASCTACTRLAGFLKDVKDKHPGYFCGPVAPFGSQKAELLVIGLAPGMHGANATGRPFTGDWCSDLLYGTLHQYGFAAKPRSLSRDDDQRLINCRLTNAVKCLPPGNKPTPSEIKACSRFLASELSSLAPRVVVCLGAVAHDALLKCLDLKTIGLKRSELKFGHGAEHGVSGMIIIDSYHPSRYNTNTGRLTEEMFGAIFRRARQLIDQASL